MWLFCCFLLYLHVQLQVLFSLCTKGRRIQYVTWCCELCEGVRQLLKCLKIGKLAPSTTRTTWAGTLPRYNTNTALLQLTNYVECLVLARTTKSLSALTVAAPSRHLPAYYIYLRKYVTTNIIKPTVHPKFLIPLVKPH